MYAQKSDAGARTLAAVIRESGTDHVGAAVQLSTSPAYYQEIHETDPVTSAAWTLTGLNAAQVGAQVG
jgi:hypothetical protein